MDGARVGWGVGVSVAVGMIVAVSGGSVAATGFSVGGGTALLVNVQLLKRISKIIPVKYFELPCLCIFSPKAKNSLRILHNSRHSC